MFMTFKASEAYGSLHYPPQRQYTGFRSIVLSALRLLEGIDGTCNHAHHPILGKGRREWGLDCGAPRGKRRACSLG